MKNFSVAFKSFAIVCVLLIGSNGAFDAQSLACPFPITNNLSCDVDVAYEFLDANCVEVCGSPTQITLTPGSNTIACCPGAVYISVHIRQVNPNGNPSCGACHNPNDLGCPSNVVTTCPTGLTSATIYNCSCQAGMGSITINPSGANIQ